MTGRAAVAIVESATAVVDRPAPAAASVHGDVASYTIEGLEHLERALTGPPLDRWEALLDSDPSGTLFQSPVWAMPWYRSYETFDPLVLVVTRGHDLIGVVPLAIEKATGRLTFAGDNMADYRDVVAHPAHRRDVVGELLRMLQRGRHGVLHVGSTYPESDTPGVLLEIAPAYGIGTHLRYNDGWRWWPDEQKEDPLRKKSVRYPINYFRRTGTLLAEHVRSEERWSAFRESFYTQHTLRQLFGGRDVSLRDPEKQAFFDGLVRSKYGHVTALWHNGTLIAGHVGAVYRGVLYWGAPSFDVRQRQYSPNLVLLALTMAERERWGFRGVDLTIGRGEVKERFSTSRANLPWVELYARRDEYLRRRARVAGAAVARRIAARVAGSDAAWEKRFKPKLEIALQKVTRVRELGAGEAGRRILAALGEKIAGHRRGIVYRITPSDFRNRTPNVVPLGHVQIHDNALEDLARRDRWDDDAAREIRSKVRAFTDCIKANRTFHTVVVDGRLAAWGHSYWPGEPARLTEIGEVFLDYEAKSVSLYDFYTLPEFRGRGLYQALLAAVLRKRFAEGAERAYVTAPASVKAACRGAHRVGFRPVQIVDTRWFFTWAHARSRLL